MTYNYLVIKMTKIAVVQFKIKQFEPEVNLKRAEEFIKEASEKAEIIIFPEDFITGPIVGREEFVDCKGKYKKHFQKLAKKYNIDIVPGSFIEGTNTGWHNTTYYIDRSGRIKGKYQKINLWLPERKYLTPGNEICVFNTRHGKIGLTICWDLIFPEIFRKMVKTGVNLVFCPSYWCRGDCGAGLKYNKNAEIELVNSICSARAFENEIVMIYCNAGGKLQVIKNNRLIQDTLIGRSQINIPFKGVVQRLNHNNEEMFIEECNIQLLRDAEKSYKIRKDIRNRMLC